MQRKRYIALAAPFFLITASADCIADEPGKKLYEFHKCINCHGSQGSAPVDDIVPVLSGKRANYLFREAKKILAGESKRDHAALMHAALYASENCDSPPNNAELQEITRWLSKQ